MDQISLREARERLLDERTTLLALAAQQRESSATVELDQTRLGRLSRMDALQGQAMAQAGQARARLRLARIEAALGRIDDGSYGECTVCGEPIAEGRLRLDPAIPLCLPCAERAERDRPA